MVVAPAAIAVTEPVWLTTAVAVVELLQVTVGSIHRCQGQQGGQQSQPGLEHADFQAAEPNQDGEHGQATGQERPGRGRRGQARVHPGTIGAGEAADNHRLRKLRRPS